MDENFTRNILSSVLSTLGECLHSACLSTQPTGESVSIAMAETTSQPSLFPASLSTNLAGLQHLRTMVSETPEERAPKGIMSDWHKKIVDIYLIIVFGTILCSFGIVANIANLVVYTRQKNKDTVSLSLTYLSVSDTGVLLGSLFSCLCYATFRFDPYTPVDAMSLQYVIGAQVRHMFINISLLTTVFVSVERCLCVVMPLKVKFLVGTRRTHAANVSFYLFIFATYIPDFISKTLEWRHDPKTNATRLMMSLAKNRKTKAEVATFGFSASVTKLGSGINNGSTSSWRKMNQRDKRVVRMVTIISTIFIICNTPMVVGMSCRRAFPEFKINGVYHNVHLTVFAVVYLASSLSASVNTFVYYFGSSKFKQTFHLIFCRGDGEFGGKNERKGRGEDGVCGGFGEGKMGNSMSGLDSNLSLACTPISSRLSE
ncbi:hypothetical protein EGW08_020160 [Elysia chlorotica]|uniref:G-protein coupled receptors family 1 profile domain-containing protein n=1 Tax=Elysia chlorotica TaxID=188477 RepID=A0A3S0Z709_ELYCH|nr:hypothetical protein EGW08_020160 [Elysia chlorotica]